uniref:F-box domain-containing protein n=2 Tax=Aegilops tauschii TaxID=37682 RepID=A0A453ADJ9_AEGTS
GGGEPRLPEELVLWEILTRLPARSLLRCRAVCTSWRRSLTSDTGLLLAHHRHQPALQLVTTGDDLEGRIDALDPRAGERRPVARTDRAASPMDLVLLAACYIGMARYEWNARLNLKR